MKTPCLRARVEDSFATRPYFRIQSYIFAASLWFWSLCFFFSSPNCRKPSACSGKTNLQTSCDTTICFKRRNINYYNYYFWAGMKWFAHNEIKTCVVLWYFISSTIEAIAGSLNPDFHIHNNCGNILPQSTSQVCGTNADDPTSLILGTVQLFIPFVLSNQLILYACSKMVICECLFQKGMSLHLDLVFIFGIIIIFFLVEFCLSCSIFCCCRSSCGDLVCYCVALVPSSGNKWSSHLTSALIYSSMFPRCLYTPTVMESFHSDKR